MTTNYYYKLLFIIIVILLKKTVRAYWGDPRRFRLFLYVFSRWGSFWWIWVSRIVFFIKSYGRLYTNLNVKSSEFEFSMYELCTFSANYLRYFRSTNRKILSQYPIGWHTENFKTFFKIKHSHRSIGRYVRMKIDAFSDETTSIVHFVDMCAWPWLSIHVYADRNELMIFVNLVKLNQFFFFQSS